MSIVKISSVITKSFANWLSNYKEENELSNADLASRFNVSESTVQHVLSGYRRGSEKLMEKIFTTLGLSPTRTLEPFIRELNLFEDHDEFSAFLEQQFDYGSSLADSGMYGNDDVEPFRPALGGGWRDASGREARRGQAEAGAMDADGRAVDLDNYIAVPFQEGMKLGAGEGSRLQLPDDGLGNPVMLYRPEIGRRARHNLRAFRVGGDSMEPTIAKGGIVVVDLDDTYLINNKIYMLRPDPDDDECVVKRVAATDRSGRVVLISDNPTYQPKAPDAPWDSIAVGRAIWFWKSLV